MHGVLAEVVLGMTAQLIDDDSCGAVVDRTCQRSVGCIGNIFQTAQFCAGGILYVGSLIQRIPCCCGKRFRALEFCHHFFFGKILLTRAGTTFIKGGDHIAHVGICFARNGDTADRYFLCLAAPVAAQDNSSLHTGSKVLLCLCGQNFIGAQFIGIQTCRCQIVRRLLDFFCCEFLRKCIIEDIDFKVIERVQAGIHIHGCGCVFGALRVTDHTDSGLVYIVERANILQRIIHTKRRVTHIGSFGLA